MKLGPCGCTDYHVADCPLLTIALIGPPEPQDPYYDILRDEVDLEDGDEDEWL